LVNIAAMVRTATQSSSFFSARDRFLDDDLPDDALLQPRSVHWESDACFTAMRKAYDMVTSIPINLEALPVCSFQAALVKELRRRTPSPWPELLRRRLVRWLGDGVTDDIITNVTVNLKEAFGVMPASVVFDALRISFNGVLTSARMAGRPAACRFCEQPAADRVEHLIACKALAMATALEFPHVSRQRGMNRASTVCFSFHPDRPLLLDSVLFCSCLYFVYNFCRHHHDGPAPGSIMLARLRHLRVTHPSLPQRSPAG
jgi:hypothetical protein